MTLSIDPSRAFLLPSQLAQLAKAVRDAGKHDESKWIEWKSSLPLDKLPGHIHLVKQILGFANRKPDIAVQWAEGYGYILVGVSPGEVKGVATVDPDRLSQDLDPYLGPDLEWSPEYVRLDEKDVLVVVVQPPRYGDPIHYLCKPLRDPSKGTTLHAEHTVFIRRNGRTVHAGREEWQMLLQRFAATGGRLTVHVENARAVIEMPAGIPQHIRTNLDRHRLRLLATRAQSTGGWPLGFDTRTREQYEAEVGEHLKDLESVFKKRLAAEIVRHEPCGLSLVVVNNTDQPFRDVRVTALIRSESRIGWMKPGHGAAPAVEFPNPPELYGTPKHARLLVPGMLLPRRPRVPALDDVWDWRAKRVKDGLHIIFDPVDVLPRDRVELEQVPLVIPQDSETELHVEWTAAGLSVDGLVTGSFALSVVPSTLKPLTSKRLGRWAELSDPLKNTES
ncbi:ATP-binding protein [Actinomadura sp. NPDC023710]|uniref:AlbA family DNA-binding domain-containing protein n=1 Tax=Actinomadura sp. NPDC023710 TaxID=3158219 RepID=UPI0033E3B713